MWQAEPGNPIFHFQTEDEKAHIFLSQRKDLKLVGWAVNFNLWIYLGEFNSLQHARETLRQALS
jgi:hypothetical protein